MFVYSVAEMLGTIFINLLVALTGRLGGLVVSVLATGPKGCGFKIRPRRWIVKDDKKPQHPFLSEGK
jgi:hypothetical protein